MKSKQHAFGGWKKETSAGAAPIRIWELCGTVIPESDEKLILSLDSYEFSINVEKCLQTFQMLMEVYSMNFFLPTGS